ncbi:hypothetical protein LTR78_000050 [Recurvomyces mirabilis]|uniref:Uncharacterized protein n=1 Tax=Recurvomyces mirabilis TaxID=574656 RepID=A0AAE0WXB6_9PEZI|nr:hypothetical protein LTR78_000050 [Recurvomyces mirabilis]KAK5161706.1 hypothetical protein LTS14_000051 [Recurvomyces mirabilis]
MGLFDLPPATLLLIFSNSVLGSPLTTLAGTGTPLLPYTNTTSLPSITTGPSYASSCVAAYSSYNAAYSAWQTANWSTVTSSYTAGGPGSSLVTFYENATTGCDGIPRVTYSPAISLSTGWVNVTRGTGTLTSVTNIGGPGFPSTQPRCQIQPSDCDPLWTAYDSSYSVWLSQNATAAPNNTAPFAQVTPPPQTPPCMNQSAASSYSSFESSLYGCGLCTIYGEGVELVYFPVPTTVSRDMCASTPLANLTHYADNAVITAYAGDGYNAHAPIPTDPGIVTAVDNNHTFTSGTAYISISTVWAVDRCSQTIGSTINNAILAMPSSSVLSLRYSQIHFQYFYSSSTQTGYPISYADFNQPVPYSAWAGQAMCEYPDDTYRCGVVYDIPGAYRPQLAIPPGIKDLDPLWEGCQMWYGGLYDPPRALQPQVSEVMPTIPTAHGNGWGATRTAAPSSTAVVSTATATALADLSGSGDGHSGYGGSGDGQSGYGGSSGSGWSGNQGGGASSGQTNAQGSGSGNNNDNGASSAWTTPVSDNAQTTNNAGSQGVQGNSNDGDALGVLESALSTATATVITTITTGVGAAVAQGINSVFDTTYNPAGGSQIHNAAGGASAASDGGSSYSRNANAYDSSPSATTGHDVEQSRVSSQLYSSQTGSAVLVTVGETSGLSGGAAQSTSGMGGSGDVATGTAASGSSGAGSSTSAVGAAASGSSAGVAASSAGGRRHMTPWLMTGGMVVFVLALMFGS